MTDLIDLIRRRLRGHHLISADFRRGEDVVAWYGAVQAQDFVGGKWALGLRGRRLTDANVQRAFDEGRILRTHVLRPTWHFVAPEDIRWMLALTGPRVQAANAHPYRYYECDAKTRTRTCRLIERALEGGRALTRDEIRDVLARGGIHGSGSRLAHLMMHAELEGLICSGPRRGKQSTYALLDERAPRSAPREVDDALAELARRYFTSHGPATLRDFVWWSGLQVVQAKRAIEAAGRRLVRESIGGLTCWSARDPKGASEPPTARAKEPVAHLLPNYDEYVIAYKDRESVVGPPRLVRSGTRWPDLFSHLFLIDGVLAGTWARRPGATSLSIALAPYGRLNRAATQAVRAAAARHAEFLGVRVDVTASRRRAV